MNILYLTTVLPNNKKTGGEIASSQCIDALRLNHHVTVVGYKRLNEDINLNNNDILIDERVIESNSSKFWTFLWLFLSLINSRSFSSQKFYSQKYYNVVKNQISKFSYDCIIIEHSQLSWIINLIPKDIPIIFNSQNVEYMVYNELSIQSNNFIKKYIYLRESNIMKEEELLLLSKSKQVWVLSDSDKKEYQKLFKLVEVYIINIPGGFEKLFKYDKKYDIGILGTWSWESNKKGLDWFIQKVLPSIDNKYRIALGGKNSLEYKNVYSNLYALGFVDNAQVFLSSCKIIVIPTTAGGGIQIKTLDAISTNRPIITTSIGVRGIDNLPKAVYVINDADSFSKKINELLRINLEYNDGFYWSQKRKKKLTKILNSNVKKLNVYC